MTWKDEILLREMERFETRDRQASGPRAPMPDYLTAAASWEIWPGAAAQAGRNLETENRDLRNQWQYLCGELKNRSYLLSDAIQGRNKAIQEADRNRRAFWGASIIAAMLLILAVVGWMQ